MEVYSVGIIAILSMSYITGRIVKKLASVAKIPRVPVENQITTLSVVTIAIKFSPCICFITFVYFNQILCNNIKKIVQFANYSLNHIAGSK